MEKISLSTREFKLFQSYIYENIGISLSPQKVSLVETRLSKRLKILNINSFKDYYQYLQENSDSELLFLIDAISTNVTSFFREPPQWEFLKNNLKSILSLKSQKRVRIWSAACSAGHEPYSIAIFLKEHIENFASWDIKILATDISPEILRKAQAGIYSEKDIASIPKIYKSKYFHKFNQNYKIDKSIRDMVLFRMFNLVYGDFKIFKSRFDIIFCRNVMIYFNQDTQIELVSKFRKILDKKSLLFVGQSESLTKNSSEFKLLQASIYKAI